jgi:hypothetical protein
VLIAIEFHYGDLTVDAVTHVPAATADGKTNLAALPIRGADNLLKGVLKLGLDEVSVGFTSKNEESASAAVLL